MIEISNIPNICGLLKFIIKIEKFVSISDISLSNTNAKCPANEDELSERIVQSGMLKR